MEILFVDLGGLSGQIGYGKVREVFTAPGGVRAGPAICYEAVYGEYFTEFVPQRGAGDVRDFERRLVADTPDIAICSLIRGCGPSKTGVASPAAPIPVFPDSSTSAATCCKNSDGTSAGVDRFVEPERQDDFVIPRYGDVIGRVSSYVFVLGLLYFMAYRFRRKSHIVD